MESALVESLLVVSLLVISLMMASVYGMIIRYNNELIVRSKVFKLKITILKSIARLVSMAREDPGKNYSRLIYTETMCNILYGGEGTIEIIAYGEKHPLNISRLLGIRTIINIDNDRARNLIRISVVLLIDEKTYNITIS